MNTRLLKQLFAICILFLPLGIFAQELQDWGEYEK